MDLYTMVVVIVAISVTAGIVDKYLKTRQKEANVSVDEGVYTELEQLSERIEVLEKIVTDSRYDLSKEIDRLER
ncbi:MAG: hypothetical protein QF921_07935 [Pseudomonadales bacterium]|nr:hypothetical protein [Pseudomonadales bacterium]MDP6471740.1 hypothetical protein [Pseudomonadales bacterium]MDP6971428.1 hypothetical protein [Pseudomonadales bacterium]